MNALNVVLALICVAAVSGCRKERPAPLLEPLAVLPETRSYEHIHSMGKEKELLLTAEESDGRCRLEIMTLEDVGRMLPLLHMRTVQVFSAPCLAVVGAPERVWVLTAEGVPGEGAALWRVELAGSVVADAPLGHVPVGKAAGMYVTEAGDIWVAGDGVFSSADGGATWRRGEVPDYRPGPNVGFAEHAGSLYLHADGALWRRGGSGWVSVELAACDLVTMHGAWAAGICDGQATLGRVDGGRIDWRRSWRLPPGPPVALHHVGRQIRLLLGPDPATDPEFEPVSTLLESVDGGNRWRRVSVYLEPGPGKRAPLAFTPAGVFYCLGASLDLWGLALTR